MEVKGSLPHLRLQARPHGWDNLQSHHRSDPIGCKSSHPCMRIPPLYTGLPEKILKCIVLCSQRHSLYKYSFLNLQKLPPNSSIFIWPYGVKFIAVIVIFDIIVIRILRNRCVEPRVNSLPFNGAPKVSGVDLDSIPDLNI